jgi:probable O-glycosylation ligase (exosortase A-associated)
LKPKWQVIWSFSAIYVPGSQRDPVLFEAIGSRGIIVNVISTSEVHRPLSWGMLFLALFAFLAIGRVTDPFPFLWPLRPVMVTGALAGLIWLLAPGTLAEKVSMKIPQMRYVLLLAVFAVISVPFSAWPKASLGAVTDGLWKLVLFFILVVYWCKSMRDAKRLVWMCSLGISTLILISLITGGKSAIITTQRFTAGSTMYDPNDLALVLAMLIPLLIFLLSDSGMLSKPLVIGMGVLYLYGIVLTQSRGGFLALLTVVSLLVFRAKLRPSVKFIVVAVVLLVFITMAGTLFWDRISTIWDPKSEYDRTAGDRTDKWKTALMIMGTRPWGTGYGVADIAMGQFTGDRFMWMTAHNSYLQIGLELGIPGLILFLSLLVRTFKDLHWIQSLSRFDQHSSERNLASMLEISLYGFVVGGFFLSQAYLTLLYLVIGLSVALSRMAAFEPSTFSARMYPWAGRYSYPPRKLLNERIKLADHKSSNNLQH